MVFKSKIGFHVKKCSKVKLGYTMFDYIAFYYVVEFSSVY